ncbi:hypothetical protein H072_4992 [Dactylellina haptotyla CBS 200.50]|uniref:B30.2/SPRY domain-containing protein n=1 Tax=Dactylellina haptotyla (strain CBS 200.50) TaxID=1284197 RepID=S8ADU1_DACHA|nr:hypothetical protein H072_4992 [Dactylellina haptotyla CBS 200.50]
MSGLTIKPTVKAGNYPATGTPSGTIPNTPTQVTAEFSVSGKIDSSKCWNEAKTRFRVKLTKTSPRPSDEIIDRFLKNNDRIDKTISECENLKTVADRQYNHSTSSKFVGKLLEVLVVVKNIGDPLLQCAPESVSIAWSAISLLISLGSTDLENCARISEACANLVTIILNCRLYENRYQKNETRPGDEEAEKIIIESVQELLAQILDFFWVANKKLRDKKIKRFFKEIFDTKVNEKYEEVIAQYMTLRQSTELAFQERVLDVLGDMKKDKAEISALLFPALKDITIKLDDLSMDIKNVLSEIQVQNKFQNYRKELKPLDTHHRQLEATLQPLRYGTSHLCQWLFKHRHYQSWESIPSKEKKASEIEAKQEQKGSHDASPEKPTKPNLMYIKGRAGFGKSVMMALAIQRLRSGQINSRVDNPESQTEGPSQRKPEGEKEIEASPVLFFFFKRGDNATQLTANAYSSLVTQLFHENHAKTKEQMEKFMAAIDLYKVGWDEQDTRNQNEDSEEKEREEALEVVSKVANEDILRIESLGQVIGKTVYIVIDGIDECTDFEAEGLVSGLISLARSKKASFKILMSSREDLNLEFQFAKDEEGQKIFGVAVTQGDPPVEGEGDGITDPFHCITHDDTTILTVTKETNSRDMKAYLDASLRQLMKRRLPRMFYSTTGDGRRTEAKSKRLVSDINRMVDSIQRKSEGMFTYSAMIVTSLDQPSPMSLIERLQNLPDGMDELYSRQLEALTRAERKLVTLALRRIIWSPTDMGTVEIAEEFKQIYIKEHSPGSENETENYEDQDEFGDGPDNGENEEHSILNPGDESNQLARRPSLHREITHSGENPIEIAMRSPEIADTVYHLEGVGRDFFKFSNEKQIIGLIHKSVRDWAEKESETAAKRDYGIKSIASLFSWDKDSDELKLTLPIPRIFVKGQAEMADFQSEKDAQLDILIYILRVLTNPLFYEVYMPDYPPEDYPAPRPQQQEEENESGNLGEQPESAKKDYEENEGIPSTREVAADPSMEADPAVQKSQEVDDESAVESSEAATCETGPQDNEKNEYISTGAPEGRSSSDKTTANGPTDSKNGRNSASNETNGPKLSETVAAPELDSKAGEEDVSKSAPNEAQILEEPALPSTEVDNRTTENDAEETEQNNGNESSNDKSHEAQETFNKGPWRCEIMHWPQHMRRVWDLWPRDERHGEKWEELKKVLRKFCDPIIFRRWQVQFHQKQYEVSLESSCKNAHCNPDHIAGILGLALLLEFVLEDDEVKIDPKALTPAHRNALHFDLIHYFPETVELYLQKGAGLNVKDLFDESPLVVLLGLPEFSNSQPIDRGNEKFQNLLRTLKIFIESGADLNVVLRGGQRPIQGIIAIGDESLVDLVLQRDDDTVDLSLTDSYGRTALHSVWEKNENVTTAYQVLVARKLLEAGANPNAEDSNSIAPLAEAVKNRNKEGIELLLDPKYEVNINDEDNTGKTALFRLVSILYDPDQDTAILLMNILLKHGADITIKDKEMRTPLMSAIWWENWKIAEALMPIYAEHYGDDRSYITAKNLYDRTFAHCATELGPTGLHMIQALTYVLTPEEKTQYFNETDPSCQDKTAFHLFLSLHNGYCSEAEYLLDQGADPLTTDSTGERPGEVFLRQWKSRRQNPKLLLSSDVKTFNKLYVATKPNDAENIYLNHAISKGDFETIECLAKIGIDPLTKDSENWDSFDWAYACGQQEAMQSSFPDVVVNYEHRKANWKGLLEPINGWSKQRSNILAEIRGDSNHTCELAVVDVDDFSNDGHLVVADHPVNPYMTGFYFEVKILAAFKENGPNWGIGFAGEGYPTDHMPGWGHNNIMAYGLHADDGRIYSPDTSLLDQESKLLDIGAKPYNVGDTVGCGYDLGDHTIFWTLNGKYLGVGFENVHHRLYPCIGSRNSFLVTANFGTNPEEPFRWTGSKDLSPGEVIREVQNEALVDEGNI